MIEHSPLARFAASERIRVMLQDETVKEALRELEAETHAAFLQAETDEARRNAWAEARALARLNGKLMGVMEDGKAAQAELKKQEQREQKPAPRT